MAEKNTPHVVDEGDHMVIIDGRRYRREDAIAQGLIKPSKSDAPADEVEQLQADLAARDARIAELEAKLAGLVDEGNTSEGSDAGDDAAAKARTAANKSRTAANK